MQPGLLENCIAAEDAALAWSGISKRRQAAEKKLQDLLQSFGNIQKKLRALPRHAHAAADQAVTLLYCVATGLAGSGEPTAARDNLEHKLWQSISEVQYISRASGCVS